MFYLILIEVLAFLAILYRLVTTNHWTVGKKLLVALVSAILIEGIGTITACAFGLPLAILMLVKVPKLIVSLVMFYFFYQHEVVVEQ